MNAKVSVFAICVEATIYLSLYNLHELKSGLILSTEKSISINFVNLFTRFYPRLKYLNN